MTEEKKEEDKEKKYQVTLRAWKTEEGEGSFLDAYINAEGDLVLEGYDFGKSVEDFWGDDDYEFWRVVKAEDVPKVLLELIKDRFNSDTDFKNWLDSKGIKSLFDSWV